MTNSIKRSVHTNLESFHILVPFEMSYHFKLFPQQPSWLGLSSSVKNQNVKIFNFQILRLSSLVLSHDNRKIFTCWTCHVIAATLYCLKPFINERKWFLCSKRFSSEVCMASRNLSSKMRRLNVLKAETPHTCRKSAFFLRF